MQSANQQSSRAEEAREQPFSRVLPWVVFVGMMFLFNYLDRAMFGPMLPALEREFGISHAVSTRFLLYISIGYSVSMFLSGFSSSKIRPRVMVSGSLLCTGLALHGIALTDNLTVLTILFVLLGFAAGQYFNGGLSTLRSLVRPAHWSKAIAIHEIGPNGSFFIAPILVELGASLLGWRGLVSGMAWISMAAGLLFFFLAKGGDYPAAPVSFKGFTRTLREPRLWLFTWLMGLAIAGEFAPFSVLTLHMIDERALAPDTAAFLLSASRVSAPFAVLCGGWVTTRLGTRRTLRLCLLAYALGMFCMAMPWFAPFAAGMFIQPVLTAMIFPPVFTLLAESFPMRDQPLVLGLGMPVASFMGVGLMPPVLGLFGDHLSFAAGFVMMGSLVALSFPLLRFMKR
ncbi:MFS transporter [Desulfovibrio sp. OttesenSCG-928-F20]|nr:MFS transporter [Desulfovibrio sp. OttesenSCG-928-F20]